MSSIPSNDIQLIDASLSKSIDDLITIESTPWATEDSSSLILQLPHVLFMKFYPILFTGVEAHISEFDSPDFRAAVEVD